MLKAEAARALHVSVFRIDSLLKKGVLRRAGRVLIDGHHMTVIDDESVFTERSRRVSMLNNVVSTKELAFKLGIEKESLLERVRYSGLPGIDGKTDHRLGYWTREHAKVIEDAIEERKMARMPSASTKRSRATFVASKALMSEFRAYARKEKISFSLAVNEAVLAWVNARRMGVSR